MVAATFDFEGTVKTSLDAEQEQLKINAVSKALKIALSEPKLTIGELRNILNKPSVAVLAAQHISEFFKKGRADSNSGGSDGGIKRPRLTEEEIAKVKQQILAACSEKALTKKDIAEAVKEDATPSRVNGLIDELVKSKDLHRDSPGKPKPDTFKLIKGGAAKKS